MRPSPSPSATAGSSGSSGPRSWTLPVAWRDAWYRLPPRLQRLLRPRALAWWCATATAAAITAIAVTGALEGVQSEAGAARRLPTLVVRQAVVPGEVLDETNTELSARAASDRPDGALEAMVPGAVATAALVAGEAVVVERLGPAGTSAAAALLAPGQRGVALPVPEGGLPLAIGDRVDVVATLPIDLAGPEGGAGVVADAASVVAVDSDTVVVGVAEADVAPLAAALAEGTVLVVLRPPGG